MFGLLKQKIGAFIGSLTKKEEQKAEEAAQPAGQYQKQPAQPLQPAEQSQTQQPPEQPQQIQASKPRQPAEPSQTQPLQQFQTNEPQPAPQILKTEVPEKTETPKEETPQHIQHQQPQGPDEAKPPVQLEKPPKAADAQKIQLQKPEVKIQQQPEPLSENQTMREEGRPLHTKPAFRPQPEERKERKLEAKLGLFTQIKGLFTKEVEISASELEPMLEELNMALLESDVTYDTAEHIISTLRENLAGKKVEKSRVQGEITKAVRTVLSDIVSQPPLDMEEFVKSRAKPVKILFLGPNGAGKTTTIAKVAFYLRSKNLTCVLAAGDTFRAAAIEQLQHHGDALGIHVVRHQYGADPSAVAYDAIEYAKARKIDCVLIDTAGRQETNLNLLKEMEKINRVVQPDLKMFVGEAIAGHALVEQAKAFHSALKIDGLILTKVDCDAKGGTSFSISHEVGVPIALLGTGQGYGDLKQFDLEWLVSNVLAE